MKKIMKIALGLVMSAVMLFAFAGCGEAAETPEDQAVAALDTTLAALKSADMTSIEELSGGEDIFGDAEQAFGSEEDIQSVLKSMFGHFDYTIGTPETVDDNNINIPVTVSNADMSKAVDTWFSDVIAYAMENPDITSDEAALQAKTIEMLETSVDKVAGEEDGILTQDVVIPMVLQDGSWVISPDVDDGVIDAILGGFVSAIADLTGSTE